SIAPDTEGAVMPMQLTCDCGRTLAYERRHIGQKVRCSACGKILTVPDPDAPPPAEVERPRRRDLELDSEPLAMQPLEDDGPRRPGRTRTSGGAAGGRNGMTAVGTKRTTGRAAGAKRWMIARAAVTKTPTTARAGATATRTRRIARAGATRRIVRARAGGA